MAISFNNIPDTIRTPGAFAEADNSRALQGLNANPHKALIIGQKIAAGTVDTDSLIAITKDNLANGFFGYGSLLARMCNKYKENNPNTELWALAISDAGAGVQASGAIQFSIALSATGGSVTVDGETYFLLISGKKKPIVLTSAWSVTDANSAAVTLINADSTLPLTFSTNATSAINFIAVNKGTPGNDLDVRANYFTGESNPTAFGDSATITAMAGGANDSDLGDAWAIIENERFNHIIQPYTDAANLISIETELDTRFGPLTDLQGHGYVGARKTQAAATTLGNSRNSKHNTILAANNSPTDSAEWGAALGAIASFYLNQDPARPLTGLKLKGILAPPVADRFTRTERDILLYDGIATFTVDSVGNVLIERAITTYQTNPAGVTDASYLDIQTLFTLGEIRDQYRARMATRYIAQRFKLADNTFPALPGAKVARPSDIKQELIALFSLLQNRGLIENLADFINNLVVERDATDRNRVNVLLPPDLVNQFRVLAGSIQFIL